MSQYIHALGVLGVIVLLAIAYGRRMNDAGASLVLTLVVAFFGAIGVMQVVPRGEVLPYLLLVDAMVAVVALRIADTPFVALSVQAKIVGWISWLKIAFTIFAEAIGTTNNARAAAVNGGFIVQVLVAGGMADGIIIWVGHRVRGAADRFGRVFQRTGGE